MCNFHMQPITIKIMINKTAIYVSNFYYFYFVNGM